MTGQTPERRALALLGFMASGKSTIGCLVARRAGAPHHDLDEIIEARCGMPVAAFFEREGEAAFRALESELLPSALEPGSVASLGGGAPLGDENWALIQQRAVSVWLDAPIEVMMARAGQGLDRPLLQGLDASGVLALHEARLARYRQADHRVDAGRPPEEVADEVWRLWRE